MKRWGVERVDRVGDHKHQTSEGLRLHLEEITDTRLVRDWVFIQRHGGWFHIRVGLSAKA